MSQLIHSHSYPPIYLFPGLLVHVPVFMKLAPLLPHAHILPHLAPEPHESLAEYAERYAAMLPLGCVLAGASFGGIVAAEVAPLVQAQAVFLLGSIRSPRELPPWLRVYRFMGGKHCHRILRIVGDSAKLVPRRIRLNALDRLARFAGPTGMWNRWVASTVLSWQPKPSDIPTYQIHGAADRTFPVRYTNPDYVIAKGQHAVSLSHPLEVAEIMMQCLRQQLLPSSVPTPHASIRAAEGAAS